MLPKWYQPPELMVFEPHQLIRFMEKECYIPEGSICGRGRRKEVVSARCAVVSVLRIRGWTYPQIGKLMGRDHTSIIHLHRVFGPKCKTDDLMRKSHAKAVAMFT